MFRLPENCKIVSGTPIVTTNTAVTCDYISLKDAHRVWVIASLLQAASHATALGITEATNVSAGSAAALTGKTFPIWKCADVSTSDALVRGTDAATVSATAGTTNQILVLEVDPSKLSAGFDCIAATLTASSEATNFVSVIYVIETRYPQSTPPTAITD